MNLLVSNPGSDANQVWLPYTWGRFRSYCDHEAAHDLSAVQWMDPIYHSWYDVDKLVQGIDLSTVDVLLLSVYVWNEERQLEIARRAKEANPAVIVIAGGPQPPIQDYQPVADYLGVVDYIVSGEGEQVISEILHSLLETKTIDITAIRGLMVPQHLTGETAPRLTLDNAVSPYLSYGEHYQRFTAALGDSLCASAIWETNRGCPFKCSYCDWGSLTASKIKRYRYETIIDELSFLCTLPLEYLYNADANYGIFKEDLDYIEHMVICRVTTGYPQYAQILVNKNKKEISNKCHRLLYEHQMLPGAQIGFQHTDQAVLDAIDRSNVSQGKMIEELQDAYEHDIPLVGVVILGNPGDTVEKWQLALAHMLDLGFHQDIRINDFMLLPNSPAGAPSYLNTYGIKTGRRKLIVRNHQAQYWAEFLLETNTYDRKDFAEMQVFSYMVMAMHILNLTRFIALFCRAYKSMPYDQFYSRLLDVPLVAEVMGIVRDKMIRYTDGTDIHKGMDLRGHLVTPDIFVKAYILEREDEFFAQLEEWLQSITDLPAGELHDLVAVQQATVVTWNKNPDYNFTYNFYEIFDNLHRTPPSQPFDIIPIVVKPKRGTIHDYHVGKQVKIDTRGMNTIDHWISHPVVVRQTWRDWISHYQDVLASTNV